MAGTEALGGAAASSQRCPNHPARAPRIWHSQVLPSPVVSGPKHQIFLAISLSQPNSSLRILERTLGSSRGPILPSSIASDRPSSRGRACAAQGEGGRRGREGIEGGGAAESAGREGRQQYVRVCVTAEAGKEGRQAGPKQRGVKKGRGGCVRGGCSEALGGLPKGREVGGRNAPGRAGVVTARGHTHRHKEEMGRHGNKQRRQSRAALRDRGFRGREPAVTRKSPRGGQVQSSRFRKEGMQREGCACCAVPCKREDRKVRPHRLNEWLRARSFSGLSPAVTRRQEVSTGRAGAITAKGLRGAGAVHRQHTAGAGRGRRERSKSKNCAAPASSLHPAAPSQPPGPRARPAPPHPAPRRTHPPAGRGGCACWGTWT